jgi:hypothetical protein
MSGAVQSETIRCVAHSVNRFTIEIAATPRGISSEIRACGSLVPIAEVRSLAARHAPWQEMLDLMARVAPLGFVIYHSIDADPIMPLAGDRAFCVSYLMGNHTIAERMFRYEPAVLLYAPLRTAIWGEPEGPAHFTFDQPSSQFASFGHPEITSVGFELDRKMATLLDNLHVPVPDALLTKG